MEFQRRIAQQRAGEVDKQGKYTMSKSQLSKLLEKKFRTSFIGDIAKIEERFGFLWGQAKRPCDRNEEESEFFELWQSLRNDILNNGNNQLRAVFSELEQYSVLYNGYNLKLDKRED